MEEQITPLEVSNAAPRRNLRWLYALPVAFALGFVVAYFVFVVPLQKEVKALKSELAQMGSAAVDVPEKVQRYDIPVDDDPAFGPADAPITIIEFSDYECPFCRKWHLEVWPRLQEEFGDQIRLVYRDFPLDGLHANAIASAQAANCAGEQGKYWEYHNGLFTYNGRYNRTAFEEIGKQVGLEMTAFTQCLDANRYKDEIEADYAFAANLGVQSTPTFFINGLALIGAQPYEVFRQVIQMELNGEIPR
ncbi:DsbA family protein [Anaerolinea sp.]|uniref:DsbA family protein n=1 Tax=Anaerolinea sp. TaxID=1872519 RepID=UPI002ACD2CFE|nr:thioredoxin domain-containing protein [Anaerolinea sp.]